MSRGDRFRRLGRAGADAETKTADLFEHFGVAPDVDARRVAAPAVIEPRPAASCRRCGWLCMTDADPGDAASCPNCGLAPRTEPPSAS